MRVPPFNLASHERRGFTLTELIVVVSILVLLMSLVVVAARKAVLMARTASCLSNQRQIAFAHSNYGNDNNGAYASNRTSTDVSFVYTLNNPCGSFPIVINNGNLNQDSYHSWTASYGTNMVGSRERASALEKGRLFPYMGDIKLYRSPLEPERDRIRSYSLNGFVGSTVPEDSSEWANGWDDWFCAKGVTPVMWRTTHLARIPQPSRTLCSITEDDSDGFNFNNQGWVVDPRTPGGTPDNNPIAATGWEGWIDWPAFWDPRNITYSYVDGSTESYSLQKPSLVGEIEGPPGAGFGHRYPEPALNGFRNDWYHFRERLLPGVIPALPLKFTPGG